MKSPSTLGCALSLVAALTVSSPVFAAQYTDTLDLTDTQYAVSINGANVDVAADITRFDLGSGWDGQIDVQLTTSNYGGLTTLGFALTTDANDTLYNDPTPFLSLSDPTTNVTQFFNDNVNGWEFYSWGSNYITAGGTSNLTSHFALLMFDPNEHYYAFVAGGSALPTTVDLDLQVSAVPVPAAVWLFGSGLLGLVGFNRRKQTLS
jgi:hypothetical protein